MKKQDDLRSPLAKVKGLGAAGNGTSTWWAQRVSAVALVPLVIWFVYFMLEAIKLQNAEELVYIFSSPFPAMLLAVFLAIGLYHGNIGIKEIIEDYVHSYAIKICLIVFINFLSFITAIAGICAILSFHLSTFSFN